MSSHQSPLMPRSVALGDKNFGSHLIPGSSDLWVVSSDCTSPDCQGIARYSSSSSSTLTLSDQPFKLIYLMGSVLGTVGTETVTLGPYEISSQTFAALANQTSGLGLSVTGNSGILGLSFPLAASIPLTSGRPILDNLFTHFDDQHRFFAFKLGRNESQDISHSDSSLTIGELDSSLTNDISQFVFTPVFASTPGEYDFWKLPMQQITIDAQPSPIAVLDTGTTLILGPTGDVEMRSVRCDRAVDVRIKLGNSDTAKEYPLHPADISWGEGKTQDGWCTGGIQANNGVDSGDWLLGAVFLRNVYAIHQGTTRSNPPMIGLLNMTDPSTALAEFTSSRGKDPAPPTFNATRRFISHRSKGHGRDMRSLRGVRIFDWSNWNCDIPSPTAKEIARTNALALALPYAEQKGKEIGMT
ncbi:aspartic peptidase domain-containing protein [Suillus occidentalis]|nr:aspartic peptidase domain-containing protein [Suillus occidentalis]